MLVYLTASLLKDYFQVDSSVWGEDVEGGRMSV